MSVNLKELAKLWDEVCNGDQKAFSTLHKTLYSRMYSKVIVIIKDEELANDILQDTFVKLWLRRNYIGKIDNVPHYFFMAARSICITYIRDFKKAERRMLEIGSNIDKDYQASIEEVYLERELSFGQKKVIEDALSCLPRRQSEIIQLRFYESLNLREIGLQTGMKYQSVVNNMYRAVQALRDSYPDENKLRVS
jgi:RNA polymerase sigma factor (sigma-70 family)